MPKPPDILRKGGAHRDRTKYHRASAREQERDMLDGIQTQTPEPDDFKRGFLLGVQAGVISAIVVASGKAGNDSEAVAMTVEAIRNDECPQFPREFGEGLLAELAEGADDNG